MNNAYREILNSFNISWLIFYLFVTDRMMSLFQEKYL